MLPAPNLPDSVESTVIEPINLIEVATQILILANSDIKPVQIKEAIFAHYENITPDQYDQAIEIAQTELDKLTTTDISTIIKAFLLSFGMGSLAALVWAIIAALTGYEIGYLAILIGLAVAYPIQKGLNKMGLKYQTIAVLAAAFGIFLGKYLTVIFIILKMTEYDLNSLEIVLFPNTILDILSLNASPFDFLWIALACGYAFILLQMPRIKVDRLKNG